MGRLPPSVSGSSSLTVFKRIREKPGGKHTASRILFKSLHPDDPAEGRNGAYFLIRRAPGLYDWGEIPSGLPAGENLRGTRTVERSPFPDEPGVYYFGGGFAGPDVQPPRPNTAWIYKGTPVPPAR